MRVHLIKKETVIDFIRNHAGSKAAFENWLTEIRSADWDTPNDFNQTFGSADLLGEGSDRVVFDVGGNNYRVICHYHFGEEQVHLYICWIGTHAEYDRLNKMRKQYTINLF